MPGWSWHRNDGQVGRTGLRHQLHADALIETHETAAMGHGQGEQIAVRDLARAQQPLTADQASLQQTYDLMYNTYQNIFKRLGFTFRAVLADSGNIGGNSSHEFHVLKLTDDINASIEPFIKEIS